ncbi:MAG: sortase, partial [Clostridiales bacterium]|nr:sortase [Clostridiales bacterium]
MRNRRGGALIGLGLGLLAAALCLAAYNLYDGVRAGKASDEARRAVLSAMPAAAVSLPQPAESAFGGLSLPDNTPSAPENGGSAPQYTLPAAPDAETAPGETEIPDYVLNPAMEMPETAVDGASYIGVLRIPALGLSLPVIGEWSDDGAKLAPCRYAGSAYTDDLVIAGHNYRTHFG